MKFYSDVKNKQLSFHDPESVTSLLGEHEGEVVEVEIKTRKKNRSVQQNSYYWGVVLKTISDYTGYETEDLHNHFKYHFLKKKVGNLDTFKSTTMLDSREFSDYIDKIIRFSSQVLGLAIPSPEDYGFYEEPQDNQKQG